MFSKNQLSHVIRNQFPEFAREEYPGFINFVTLYYKYLDSIDGRNLDSIRDIDETLDVFVDKFKKELGLLIPTVGVESDRFFLKHIKDLYSAKGTEEGYRILFRHFFNTEIEIKYPQENIFKASDGKWNQDVSIMLSETNGSVYDIVGKHVQVNTPTQVFEVFVNRVRSISGTTNYEVFLAPFYYGNISVGDILTYNEFKGTIQPAVNKIRIDQPGIKFKVGQLYDVNSDTGSGTRIKVTRVGTNGELLAVQIIKFGTGYTSNFYSSIISGYDPLIYDPTVQYSQTGGFVDHGALSKATYFEGDYTGFSYTGEVVQTFYNEYSVPDGTTLNDERVAVVELQLGPIQRYPGYYSNSDGFASDSMYLQDNHYYQTFSYVIKANQALETYKNIVRQLLHPAGLALFGEYNLQNTFDLSATVKLIARYIMLDFQEEVFAGEDSTWYFAKSLSDSFTASTATIYTFIKSLHDIILSTDTAVYKLDKLLNDVFNITETLTTNVGKYLTDSVTVSESAFSIVGKEYLDSFWATDTRSIEFAKQLLDTYTADDITTIQLNKNINDAITGIDTTTIEFSKYLTDSTLVSEMLSSLITKLLTDTVTISDSGSVSLREAYYLEDYVVDSLDYAVYLLTLQTF